MFHTNFLNHPHSESTCFPCQTKDHEKEKFPTMTYTGKIKIYHNTLPSMTNSWKNSLEKNLWFLQQHLALLKNVQKFTSWSKTIHLADFYSIYCKLLPHILVILSANQSVLILTLEFLSVLLNVLSFFFRSTATREEFLSLPIHQESTGCVCTPTAQNGSEELNW